MYEKKILLSLFLLFFLTNCKSPEPSAETKIYTPGKKAKNIILMIGDGMGLAQITAAMYTNKNRIALEQFPYIGFHKQHSYNDLITDSAAGATAFACGVKTYNNAIGVSPDTVAVESILEEAKLQGKATGVVVTSIIVHATPASFYAHQPLRVFYEDIALDLMDEEVDFVVGGGKAYFNQRKNDNRNLYFELTEKGYQTYSFDEKTMNGITINPSQNFIYFTSNYQPPEIESGRNYLPYASLLGADFLSKHSEEGFFLLVEGSQIDWRGHSNEGKRMIKETLDFNNAIKRVLDFASRRDDTLVIVTADHETGGMAIQPGSKMRKIETAFTTNNHTGTLVPVFAFGPSAELFAGIYDNTEIYKKMREAYGFDDAVAKNIDNTAK
ncbi:MAG: alkaline phosphatase [Saprospiraceae bacterium]|nr:alkaline phosphatase [Saprospiraceae bacterium]